ncbi:type VII secretion protein EccE [Amycolatopsis taiwanensis]|uniref:type VII secretion protein EccE n=1 Tax=Amycolatopsis taiwanensis TaxID=342230 RepID=UPI0004B77953|nr:type VII secretion protein EccE [Amycolatopsis taiwanensis]
MVQIICCELAVLALALTIGRSWATTGSVAFGSFVVVAITAARIRGRWAYEWLILSYGYLSRRRDRDLPGAAGGALLRSIAPETKGFEDTLDGDQVFLVSRAAGISAVLQPAPGPLPPAEAMLPPSDERGLAFAVQVIHHVGPGGGQAPRVWVALQALRTIDVHQDTDIRRELGNALRRVRRRLRRDGLSTVALGEREFCGTVASLAHVTAGRGRVREEWRLWHSGPIAQATFRLGGWARLSAAFAPQVVRGLLAAAPHAAVTISVTTSRSATATRTDATMRVAAASLPVLEQAAQTLARLADGYGLATERLDGRHAWGLAATLPIGLPETPRSR